jgi:hypothetical protein
MPAIDEPRFEEKRRPVPLMPQVAIVTTIALIAAPILPVAGTLAMAAKKRLQSKE